jgi:hypothetical protein
MVHRLDDGGSYAAAAFKTEARAKAAMKDAEEEVKKEYDPFTYFTIRSLEVQE